MTKRKYFGVSLPAWRNKKVGSGAFTIWFVISGRVPSKKNSQQAVTRRKEAYTFLHQLFKEKKTITKSEAIAAVRKVSAKMRGNDLYKTFFEEQTPVIEKQRQFWLERYGPKGLIFPISQASMNIRFYFAQKHRQDSVNKQQSIQDLLKDCNIIFDDDYTCINPIMADGDCFQGEISDTITFVSLTFRLRAPLSPRIPIK